MTVARLTALSDFVSLRDAMERLPLTVPVDLWETPDAYHLRADLPGLAPEEIEINATSDTISIAGEMKAQANISDEGWLRQERRVGKLQRSLTLPIQIEPNKINAADQK